MRNLFFVITTLLILLTLALPAACKTHGQVDVEPARFVVISFDVIPSEVPCGEKVSVIAKVANIGGTKGTYDAILVVNRIEVERKAIIIEAGAIETIIFTFSQDIPGNYTIEFAGNSKNLVVTKVEPEYSLSNPRLFKIKFVNIIRNEGPGTLSNLEGWLIIPPDTPAQRVINFSIEPEPTAYLTDRWGQRIAYYNLQNIASGAEFVVAWTVKTEVFDIKYNIKPDKVGSLEQVPEKIKEKYTLDEKYYDIHNPIIKEAAKQAIGDEKNLYYAVKKIHDYVVERLEYKLDKRWDTAPTVLTQGHGSCSEYTFLFIALCRANGIPARFVGGTSRKGDGYYQDSIFHRIAEVYFPNYGWVPIDVTWNDSERVDKYKYFGVSKNNFFTIAIAGGESEYLGWNYIAINKWRYAGEKASVKIIRRAEWIPQ